MLSIWLESTPECYILSICGTLNHQEESWNDTVPDPSSLKENIPSRQL